MRALYIPANVKEIGKSAFSGCNGLRTISISDGVYSIGDYAFNGCGWISSVTLPKSVTTIGKGVFAGCSHLASVTIPSSYGLSFGDEMFVNCTSLESFIIPEGITSIGLAMFRSCKSLSSVTIPASVKSIAGDAFAGCNSLQSIILPNSLTRIEKGAFSFSGLRDIIIPRSVISVAEQAFLQCTSLTSVTINNENISLEKSVFELCHALKTVKAPNGLNPAARKAFKQGVVFESAVIEKEKAEAAAKKKAEDSERQIQEEKRRIEKKQQQEAMHAEHERQKALAFAIDPLFKAMAPLRDKEEMEALFNYEIVVQKPLDYNTGITPKTTNLSVYIRPTNKLTTFSKNFWNAIAACDLSGNLKSKPFMDEFLKEAFANISECLSDFCIKGKDGKTYQLKLAGNMVRGIGLENWTTYTLQGMNYEVKMKTSFDNHNRGIITIGDINLGDIPFLQKEYDGEAYLFYADFVVPYPNTYSIEAKGKTINGKVVEAGMYHQMKRGKKYESQRQQDRQTTRQGRDGYMSRGERMRMIQRQQK